MATKTIVVTVRAPAALIPSPASISQVAGTTAATTWTVLDAQGVELSGYTVTVTSGTPAAVTVGAVSASGGVHSCTATMVAAGSSTLTGSVVGTSVTATIGVTVTGAPVTTPVSLSASPGSVAQTVGTSRDVVFTPLDSQGSSVTGATVTVSTSSSAIATVTTPTINGATHTTTVSCVTAGSATVTGTITSVTPNISVNVPVTVSAAASAWRTNTFGGYANIQALLNDTWLATRTNGWWSGAATAGVGGNQAGGEVVNANRMTLETDGGPAVGSSNYLRYTFPSATGPVCADYSISENIKFGSNLPRIWFDCWVRFSSNYNTGSGSVCTGRNPDYKFIFGRTNDPGGGRFEIKLFNGGNKTTVYWPGCTPSPGSQVIDIASSVMSRNPPPYKDGLWHRWRIYCDVSVGGVNGNAGMKVWFDNTLIYDSANDPLNPLPNTTTATSVYGIGIGRNMNMVPLTSPDITVDWGYLALYNTDPGW